MGRRDNLLLVMVTISCLVRFSFAQQTRPQSDSDAKPVRLTIYLPADAELEIEGAKVTESGEVRHFESSPFTDGKKHVLKLKATWKEGDNSRTVNKKLVVQAGQELDVDFHLEDLSADERKVLELTNQERTKAGVSPLKVNARLSCAARVHSANMARQDMLAHELDGKGAPQRIADAGYRLLRYGENVAEGSRTPAEVLRLWMNSPPHRENILDANLKEIGIAMSSGPKGKKYWTQVFATPAGR